MGHKLEYFLIVLIFFLAMTPNFFKVKEFEKRDRVIEAQKDTEISNFTQYDINQTSIEYKLKSPLAQELGDIWFLMFPEITNEKIKRLTSTYAILRGKNIEFIENVKLLKYDGKIYNSQRAIYNTVTKVVLTPERFNIIKEYDMVNGVNMEYFTNTKETKAKNVKATFILKK